MTAVAVAQWGAARLAQAGLPEPRREARLLLRAVAEVDTIMDPQREIEPDCAATYVAAIGRRASREPFAYIVGRRFFRETVLEVDHRVLIPRPETEGVVDRALALAPGAALAADLCTGSGAIAIALASELPDLHVDATDISASALEVARRNVQRHALDGRMVLWLGDLWDALPTEYQGGYDLCTCNPPYVDAADFDRLQPEVRLWEPRIALVPEQGWMAVYSRLASGATRWLRPGGWLIVEVGQGQADVVGDLFGRAGLGEVTVHADLAGIPRVVEGRRPR